MSARRVTVVEVGPRDGLQNEQDFVPTDAKVAFVDALSALIGAAFFGIVAWRVALWGIGIMSSGEVSETLKIAYHPFVFGVAAGFGLLAFTSLLDVFRALRRGGREEKA